MQYGNFIVTRDYSGLFNITSHAVVDLHTVEHSSLILTSPTTYATTKIGTAKVRNIDYVSGTGVNQLINMYLYDVVMTSSAFDAVKSIIVPESPLSGAVTVNAKCNIDNTGKVSGAATATVQSVVVTGAGVGYTSVPTVTFSGGGGSTQATGTAVLSGGSSGTLTSVTVVTAGVGYTSAPVIAFSSAGSSTAATAASASSSSRWLTTRRRRSLARVTSR